MSIPIPDVPINNVCLFRFQWTGTGSWKFAAGTPYGCPTAASKTVRVGTTIDQLPLKRSGPPCDETEPFHLPDLVLHAQGNTIYREDGFGFFNGVFMLRDGGTDLFRGHIELFERVTTRQQPIVQPQCAVSCQPEAHIEGWLVGEGSATTTSRLTVRALLAAQSSVPSPLGAAAVRPIQNLIITGTVLRPL